jgi:hypothetical protein
MHCGSKTFARMKAVECWTVLDTNRRVDLVEVLLHLWRYLGRRLERLGVGRPMVFQRLGTCEQLQQKAVRPPSSLPQQRELGLDWIRTACGLGSTLWSVVIWRSFREARANPIESLPTIVNWDWKFIFWCQSIVDIKYNGAHVMSYPFTEIEISRQSTKDPSSSVSIGCQLETWA